MVKKRKVSPSEKTAKKMQREMERELNKLDNDLLNETDISNLPKQSSKGKKTPKQKKISPPKKSVKNMNRDELLHYATSVAQHSNKTLREFEKAEKSHLHTPGHLLSIAEEFNLKTKGNRVSRSFKKLSDEQLKDFVNRARRAYTGKSVSSVTAAMDKKKENTISMLLRTAKEDVDEEKLRKMGDEFFNKLYERLNEGKTSGVKNYSSDEVVFKVLAEFNLLNKEDDEDYRRTFLRQRESMERFERNKLSNRSKNRGRRR